MVVWDEQGFGDNDAIMEPLHNAIVDALRRGGRR
jgi:hypothetical protein